MKKRDSDKNPFEKKNLVKLAPAAVVIAAVAAAGAQAGSSGKEVTAETREVVKSQDLESLLKTAYSYETADDEAEEESLLKTGKNTSSASSKKKTSKISKKKNGIKKGSSKTLPVKTAASSGVGQGSTTTPTTEVPEGGYKDGTYQGSGTGFGGMITVQVTVSGGKITAVDILSASGETGSYFASAQGVVRFYQASPRMWMQSAVQLTPQTELSRQYRMPFHRQETVILPHQLQRQRQNLQRNRRKILLSAIKMAYMRDRQKALMEP